jgi:ABC-type polysaccharide/polyol phosphate export permease
MNSNWANLVARRDLLRELVVTDLRVSTAQTRLGWLWWVLDPLLMMLIYSTIVIGLLGAGKARYAPYWIFIFIALVTWKQLTTTLSKSCLELTRKKALIRAIPFPTMLLPLSQALSSFAHFLFGFAIIAVVSLFATLPHHSGSHLPLLQIPLLFVLQLGVVAGLSLPLACLGVSYRDVGSLVPHLTRVGFYLSPGLYGVDMVHEKLLDKFGESTAELAFSAYMLNPFAILIDGYRQSILYGEFIEPRYWLILVLEAALFLILGYRYFQRHDRAVIKFL